MINDRVRTATKWSLLTEALAKVIVPITNILLAHILSPAAFGIVATITMVTSFAEMLADAGFQKFLVQHEFSNEKEKKDYVDVAFTINLILVVIILSIIFFTRDRLATLIGNPGSGIALTCMSLTLPFTAFSSIQMAMYRRNFNFKFLMKVRLVTICTPVLVSIPLAVIGFDYWSLIIGTVLSQVFTAIVISIWGTEKISFKFDCLILSNMFGFSAWSMLEAFSIWLTIWIDTFIIGNAFDSYYLGLYKTPAALVNSAMSLVTASIIPVLYAALSRLQDLPTEFEKTFFAFQRYVAMVVVPIGVGLFIFRDMITYIVFGSRWEEAGIVLGTWALSSSIMVVSANMISEIFRAKGHPKLSFWAQISHLVVLIPVVLYAVHWGFEAVVYARSIVRLELLGVELLFLYFCIKINPWKIFYNIWRYIFISVLMGLIGYCLLQINNSVFYTVAYILICIIFYIGFMFCFRKDRIILATVLYKIRHK